jgi:hypothetical protein
MKSAVEILAPPQENPRDFSEVVESEMSQILRVCGKVVSIAGNEPPDNT